jgi:hypothetical protein
MSGLFTVFIFFAVIALTAVLFCGWIAFVVIRAVIGGVGSLFMPSTWRPRGPRGPRGRRFGTMGWGNGPGKLNTVQCPTRMCGAINPMDARFCRRCGRGLPAAQRVNIRRAAVW